MPFVAEKVTKMFFDILAKTNIQNEVDSLTEVDVQTLVKKKKKRGINILKNKIKFISKMAKMQKILREENENIIKIKVKLNSQCMEINCLKDSFWKGNKPLRHLNM